MTPLTAEVYVLTRPTPNARPGIYEALPDRTLWLLEPDREWTCLLCDGFAGIEGVGSVPHLDTPDDESWWQPGDRMVRLEDVA